MQRNLAFINLGNIQSNAKTVKNLISSAKLCAVVKCNAYGHGAIAVSHALEACADTFAVALVDEGVELRVSGIGKDILVLQPALCETEVLRAAAFNLILTLASDDDFFLVNKACHKFSITVRVHLKCNTGMNRLGYEYWQFSNSCLMIKGESFIKVEGVYSHFYLPDAKTECKIQFNTFIRFCSFAERVFGKLIKHISATGGVFCCSEYHLDMVRVGIALYGYTPRGIRANSILFPSMEVYTHAVQNRKYETGGIAYGRVNGQYDDLTTLRVGYGDGFFRTGKIGNVNNLCMDACVLPQKYVRGELVPVMLNADEYAKRHNTISYEVLCSVTKRAQLVYIE